MKFAARSIPVLALATALALAAAHAQQPQQPQPRGGAPAKAAPPPAAPKIAFSEGDVKLIKEFYAAKPAPAKKADGKPAGQKPLAKGDKLAAGIGKGSVPPELYARLSHIPDGYARFVIGADVVLVDPSQVVLDIVAGVVR